MPGASVYTAGPGTFINNLIASAGGLNVVHEKGQRWPQDSGWIEVEGGGAVTRRLVATDQIVTIELFERP